MTSLVTALPDRQRAVVYVYLKTGSRFESQAENGLSHFVEHMLFRGTEEHPSSHRFATAFEELGGTLEAMTAADHGSLSINVPQENLEGVLSLLPAVFTHPLFLEVELERGIIVEEILEDLNEKGELIDPASLTRKLAFAGHGLAQPITGPVENVERFSIDVLRNHHRRTYQGRDAVISVAGPLDPDKVARSVEATFSKIPRGETELTELSPPSQDAPRVLHVDHPGSSQTAVALAYRCPGRTDVAQPALDMLLRILDDGMSTRLYHEICDSRGLCYSVGASYETYHEAGLVELEADTAHERASLVLEQMLRVTDELASEPVSEKELERARNRARWQHEALLDDVDEMADFLAMGELTKTPQRPADRLQELLAVTRADIQDVAGRVFDSSCRNVVSVGTQKRSGRARLSQLALRKT